MENVLSTEETNALLQGIEDGSVATGHGTSQAGEARPYDFAERNSIVRGRWPVLERIHERFARELASSFGALLRRELEVAPLELRQLKLADYLRSLAAPGSLTLFEARPLPGRAVLTLDPALVYLAVDSYFGGPARAPERIQPRALTAAEQRVIELLRERAFLELRKAWAPVKALELAPAASESDPQFFTFGQPGDPLIVARFEVGFGDAAGFAHLAWPASLLEPVREQLDAGLQPSAADAQAQWRGALAQRLADAPIELRCSLVSLTISLRELLALKPGDVIPADLQETVTVVSDRTPLFRARFGASRGYNALRIAERLPSKTARS